MISENNDYEYILDTLGDDIFKKRIDNLYNRAFSFIKNMGYINDVSINDELLRAVIIDYYADVFRLKEFNPELKHINYQKIYSHTAYWWLRRKPIQILKNDNRIELSYVNEEFLAYYILYCMSEIINMEKCNSYVKIDINNNVEKEYIDRLKYFFKYRAKDAQSIEEAIEAFTFCLKLLKK